ncbi:MAG: amidohydrolase family protein [Eggerthellaceae bacterium]
MTRRPSKRRTPHRACTLPHPARGYGIFDYARNLRGPLRTYLASSFFDGVSSQHTAYLHAPYTTARFEGPRQTTVPFSIMTLAWCRRKGYPARIHTIGDEAIHEALDTSRGPRAFRLRIRPQFLEHLENFQPDDIARFARLGVTASAAAAHHARPHGSERDLGVNVANTWLF